MPSPISPDPRLALRQPEIIEDCDEFGHTYDSRSRCVWCKEPKQ